MVCAALVLALLACIGERLPVRPPPSTSIVSLLPAMQVFIMEERPLGVVAGGVTASAALGAAMGVFAKRVRGSPARRGVVTFLAGVPVLWFVIAITITTMVLLPAMVTRSPEVPLVGYLLVALLWATMGLVPGAPFLAPALIAAALILEGWTRPESLPQTGLARTRLRTGVLIAFSVVAAALTTLAILNWRGGPGAGTIK